MTSSLTINANTIPFQSPQNTYQNINNLSDRPIQTKINIIGDLLFLKADQIATWGLNVNYRPYTTSEGTPAVNYTEKTEMVIYNWDFGIRTGLGYIFERDCWDTQIYYTRFRTEKTDAAIAGTDSNITGSFLGEWLTYGFASRGGRLRWRILLNAIDWELGRDCRPGKGFSFRPHIGIKGASILQSIHSHWISDTFGAAKENIHNDFWGLGLKSGVHSKWGLNAFNCNEIYLFGDLSLALLGGCWNFKDIQKSAMVSQINAENPTVNGATFMGHALYGFGWDHHFDHSNFGVRVGYELQYWYDQLKIFTFLEGTLHAALVLQGGMLDVHFDF